jgi:hypothetical protein
MGEYSGKSPSFLYHCNHDKGRKANNSSTRSNLTGKYSFVRIDTLFNQEERFVMAQQHQRGSHAPGFTPQGNSRKQQDALREAAKKQGKPNGGKRGKK